MVLTAYGPNPKWNVVAQLDEGGLVSLLVRQVNRIHTFLQGA